MFVISSIYIKRTDADFLIKQDEAQTSKAALKKLSASGNFACDGPLW